MTSSEHIDLNSVLLILIGGLAAHISVNTFNEYCDFNSGLDFKTQKTAFSGGSGALPENPQLATAVLSIAFISLAIAALVGGYFLFTIGWSLLPLGLLGIAIIVLYTPYITKSPLSSLLAPGLSFGPLMVMGTDVVLSGNYSITAFAVSLVPFFLVNNLLLLNQFPDTEADRAVNRKNYPILIGKKRSSLIYTGLMLLGFIVLPVTIINGYLPATSLLGEITVLAAIPCAIGVYRHADNTAKLMPYMKINVAINLLTPPLIATGLLISEY